MIIRKGTARTGRAMPEQARALGLFTAELMSDTGGLTRFGALTEPLAPGASSSGRHWHEAEDAFLCMLAGEATVIDDDGALPPHPGNAVCWKAGVADGHHVHNRSAAPRTHLIVATHAVSDRVHYSDIDKICTRENGVARRTRRDGSPLE